MQKSFHKEVGRFLIFISFSYRELGIIVHDRVGWNDIEKINAYWYKSIKNG
jgi:hypothetical protein